MRKGRLLKLAKRLDEGLISAKVFTMAHWRQRIYKGGKVCGFSGCAIGECPSIFPSQWAWGSGDNGVPMLRENSHMTPVEDGMGFFGLTSKEFHMLFYPNRESATLAPLVPDHERGPKTVAAEIREFVRCGNVDLAVRRVRDKRKGEDYRK